jgi:hypothetical protein
MTNINDKKELVQIIGGAKLDVSGALLNAFKGCANTILDVGRSLGSAIRRLAFGSLCRL